MIFFMSFRQQNIFKTVSSLRQHLASWDALKFSCCSFCILFAALPWHGWNGWGVTAVIFAGLARFQSLQTSHSDYTQDSPSFQPNTDGEVFYWLHLCWPSCVRPRTLYLLPQCEGLLHEEELEIIGMRLQQVSSQQGNAKPVTNRKNTYKLFLIK